jgi:hypothetical protein
MLEGDVIGQIEVADARGVAAAAEVLEQERVVEVGQFRLAEPEFGAYGRADEAAANAMALRLAFGHVERIAQRAEQFGRVQAGRRRMRATVLIVAADHAIPSSGWMKSKVSTSLPVEHLRSRLIAGGGAVPRLTALHEALASARLPRVPFRSLNRTRVHHAR